MIGNNTQYLVDFQKYEKSDVVMGTLEFAGFERYEWGAGGVEGATM